MTECFVFGSNLAGRHGAGSALEARRHWGAVQGRGYGLQDMIKMPDGDRRTSYAIPTKDNAIQTLPLHRIEQYCAELLRFAEWNPAWEFRVVAIGCGLAGYRPDQIAPMFRDAPPNCRLPEAFTLIS